jgi:hypothetical protein
MVRIFQLRTVVVPDTARDDGPSRRRRQDWVPLVSFPPRHQSTVIKEGITVSAMLKTNAQ